MKHAIILARERHAPRISRGLAQEYSKTQQTSLLQPWCTCTNATNSRITTLLKRATLSCPIHPKHVITPRAGKQNKHLNNLPCHSPMKLRVFHIFSLRDQHTVITDDFVTGTRKSSPPQWNSLPAPLNAKHKPCADIALSLYPSRKPCLCQREAMVRLGDDCTTVCVSSLSYLPWSHCARLWGRPASPAGPQQRKATPTSPSPSCQYLRRPTPLKSSAPPGLTPTAVLHTRGVQDQNSLRVVS